MSTAIEFNNISKQYHLGLVSTRMLSHDLTRWWHVHMLGKEDPYLKLGSVNNRATAADSDFVWALKDINLSIEQGDVVGIIGSNGSGKSTLLKILSRVTGPTTGEIRAKGRIGSLLEVGTGFHPEMTGRENIYMNGAILGMTKNDITRKLDEIIDFSGCERYIDTPVKRYSSGMMVRLGFAVAAHLEPEILIVDEVLAVGDAEFQKKAVGKMQDVSKGEGRTVLFVSHNMAAVKNLCKRGIVLQNGLLVYDSDASDAVDHYLHTKEESIDASQQCIKDRIKYLAPHMAIDSISFNNSTSCKTKIAGNQRFIEISVEGSTDIPIKADLSFIITNKNEEPVAEYNVGRATGEIESIPQGKFIIKRRVSLPRYINTGVCWIDIALHQPDVMYHLHAPHCVKVVFEGSHDNWGRAEKIEGNGFYCMESFHGNT